MTRGAAFRAVSGLVLALLITTVAVVAITTQDTVELTKFGTAPEANVLTDQLTGYPRSLSPGHEQVLTGPGPAAPAAPLAARLRAIPGVQGVAVVRQDLSVITWPAVTVPASRLDGLAVAAINVATDGSVPAIEQARTVLEGAPAYSGAGVPSSIRDLIRQDDSSNNAYQQLANVVILVSLPIAGCTLAAGIAAGLADRKRPFSLLRLTGARLAMLRRVVALEGAVPLIAVAAVAIGTGFGAAAMNASLQQNHSIVSPGAAYYLITAGGILVSLAIIAATFPLLARITGPEVARNE